MAGSGQRSIGAVATMIEEAEAEFGVVEIVATHVELLDVVREHIVGQSLVLDGRTASFVVVGRHVRAEGAERAEAVARDRNGG